MSKGFHYAFLVLCLAMSSSFYAQIFRLSDYLGENEKDATLAMISLLQDAVKHKNSKVIVEKGTYHFYPEKAYEQYTYITNHDNSLRRTAFPIKNFKGLTIDANHSTFIFHGVMMPFNIEESHDVTVSNLSIDWHMPLHSEALVVAEDSVNNTFDIQIDQKFPYTIRNEQLIFIKEGFEHNLDHAILYDPERKAIAYNTTAYTPLKTHKIVEVRNKEQLQFPNYVDFRHPSYESQNQENILNAEELKPGLIRIYGSKRPLPPVGKVIIFKGRFGTERIANAFHILKSKNVRLQDITIYHAGGMGVLGERSEDITLEGVNVLANADKNLMVSTTADAAHFSSCRGKITVNNCNFRHQLDDAINIHGAYVLVEDVLEPNKIGVRIGHFQQAGFEFAQEGDTLGFVNRKLSDTVAFKATVESFQRLNKDYYIITLNENVGDNVEKGIVVENLDWYPEVSITNSQFADNRARGLLLKSPKKTVVKNNYFSNMMSAILISGGINTWWYESGGAQDILIQGNTFEDSAYGGANQPVITIGGKYKGKGRMLGSIVIRDNVFRNFQPSILRAKGIKYLEFSNNTISQSTTFPALYPDEFVLEIRNIEKLNIHDVSLPERFENKLLVEDIGQETSSIKAVRE